MNLWKATFITIFSALTLLCVSYAHSESLGLWKAPWWIGGCSLKVEKDQAGQYLYSTPDQDRIVYEGFWPSEPSELLLESPSQKDIDGRQLLGPDLQADNTLIVKFEMRDSEVQPVSYSIKRRRLMNGKYVKSEFSCAGLKKRH